MFGAVCLMAQFAWSRVRNPHWRFSCTLATAVILGLNGNFVQYGSCSQAYAICMFMGAATFRAAAFAVSRRSAAYPFAVGLFAGTAAGSSLLTAPIAPVTLLWLAASNRAGNRWVKATAFALGAALPFAPVFRLLHDAPRQTIFNILQYQTLFRRADWPGATEHDIDILSTWVSSAPALLLCALAAVGFAATFRRREEDPATRSEIQFAGWLALALALFISTAHPTFERYYVVALPFAAVLAARGLQTAAERLGLGSRPFWPTFAAIALVALSLAKQLFDDRDSTNWGVYERMAAKVDQVTPLQAPLYMDELTYFAAGRPVPSGMEFSYARKLQLSPADAALFHITTEKVLNSQVRAGHFALVQTCDDDVIDDLELDDIYNHREDFDDCSVFWSFKPGR
jgi:hypothetical protein